MVGKADAIVRATAIEYMTRPDPNIMTTGEPSSTIRFKVLEVIRGPRLSELVLHGYLSDRDDFNDQPSPYNFVRPTGRRGSCFSYTYRSGERFLLFLKRKPDDSFTTAWYALGPVNEQLHWGERSVAYLGKSAGREACNIGCDAALALRDTMLMSFPGNSTEE
jgi:hypothetical protein